MEEEYGSYIVPLGPDGPTGYSPPGDPGYYGGSGTGEPGSRPVYITSGGGGPSSVLPPDGRLPPDGGLQDDPLEEAHRHLHHGTRPPDLDQPVPGSTLNSLPAYEGGGVPLREFPVPDPFIEQQYLPQNGGMFVPWLPPSSVFDYQNGVYFTPTWD